VAATESSTTESLLADSRDPGSPETREVPERKEVEGDGFGWQVSLLGFAK